MTTYNGRIVSKLSSEAVDELRRTRPETGREAWYREQAKRLGVHRSTVARACCWIHHHDVKWAVVRGEVVLLGDEN